MAGARRQIFIAFSVLLLVQGSSSTRCRTVTILFIINNTINYFPEPPGRKNIIRFGERKVLSLEYLSVIFLFTAYATTDSKLLVAFIYIRTRSSSPSPSPYAPISRRWATPRTSRRAWPWGSPSTTWRPSSCQPSAGCSGSSTTASPSSPAPPWVSCRCWRCRR